MTTTAAASSRPAAVAVIPNIVYGTAWKAQRTAELVYQALSAGFRGIDTACQPKHYFEPGVGVALEKAIAANLVRREDVFLQTKFTALSGQDTSKPIPYDPRAPLPEQVRQSVARSLSNLKTDYIDSLVLHSPMDTHEETMVVWRTMEDLHRTGKVLRLGISNIYDIGQLRALIEQAAIPPQVVQNRFYADSSYDVDIRALCRQRGMTYQTFWTLTANPHVVASPFMASLVTRKNAAIEQRLQRSPEARAVMDTYAVKTPYFTPSSLFLRYVRQLGGTPLTGTTSDLHMQEDLFALSTVEAVFAAGGVQGLRDEEHASRVAWRAGDVGSYALDEAEMKAISDLLVTKTNRRR